MLRLFVTLSLLVSPFAAFADLESDSNAAASYNDATVARFNKLFADKTLGAGTTRKTLAGEEAKKAALDAVSVLYTIKSLDNSGIDADPAAGNLNLGRTRGYVSVTDSAAVLKMNDLDEDRKGVRATQARLTFDGTVSTLTIVSLDTFEGLDHSAVDHSTLTIVQFSGKVSEFYKNSQVDAAKLKSVVTEMIWK